MALDVKDIRDAYEYDENKWAPIRREAKTDMRYVSGDPWDDTDKQARKNRPTVAPEEMGQYFNQVINSLKAHPRGMKFAPTGNGANDKSARFYQDKAREIEYRSKAPAIAYITAAENAIQRSYGFVRVHLKYASPRSANQEIWIDAFPNPDMVMPDADALQPDSSDMQRCFVSKWIPQAEFTRKYPKAKIQSFGEWSTTAPRWVQGQQVLVSEFWKIQTRPRTLVLVEQPAPVAPSRLVVPAQVAPPVQQQVFSDEVPAGWTTVKELRKVDYPEVWMYLTNGLEILGEPYRWLGKYIPIVSCYGKTLYMDGPAGMEKKILSMTRFGRDPWKSYCYAASQELEVLGMVPKAPLQAWVGQLRDVAKDWEESPHIPKAFLLKHHLDENGQPYPQLDGRIDFMPAQHLQALEVVKEGWRRAIQAAMGSNFMPTQAQRRNEKSGIALEKIEQAAAQGTYHFVHSYEGMIQQVGVIIEDLIDKIHDYRGETGIVEADGTARTVTINDPSNKDAFPTKGDHVVTISTAPSSDSEREAADAFTDTLVQNLETIVGVAGQKAGAAVLARAIRMRNLGPRGDQLADIIEPPEYKTQEGQEPPSPREMALQNENQQLKQVLQQASQEKQAKVVEIQGKYAIAHMQEEAETERQQQKLDVESHVKVYVAELSAKVDRMATLAEANALIVQHLHQAWEAAKDRVHDREMAHVQHQQALEAGQQGVAGQLAVQAAAPQPQEAA